MTIWPSRTWAIYPGPNRCEDGCGREATVRLVWAQSHAQTESYCASCAVQEEIKLEAAGAGCARVELSSIIGAMDAPKDEAAGGCTPAASIQHRGNL
jgi:hypothetical protein